MNDILATNLGDCIPNQNPTRTTNHHHRVLMLMSLQGRVTARTNLEITKLNRKIALALKHHLPRDVAEHIPVLFVRQNVYAFPPKITRCLNDHDK